MDRERYPKEEADEIEQLQAGEAQVAEPQRPRLQAVSHAAAEKDSRGPLEQKQGAGADRNGRGPRRGRERGTRSQAPGHRRRRKFITMRARRIHINRCGLGAHVVVTLLVSRAL
jgi:hypothetical protein